MAHEDVYTPVGNSYETGSTFMCDTEIHTKTPRSAIESTFKFDSSTHSKVSALMSTL